MSKNTPTLGVIRVLSLKYADIKKNLINDTSRNSLNDSYGSGQENIKKRFDSN